MPWLQNYDPFHNQWLSATVAALPVVVLLAAIAWFQVRIHFAAVIGLALAWVVALFGYQMPAKLLALTTLQGALFGLFPIGWIILNVMFLYQLTVQRGHFEILRNSLAHVAPDPRIQLILIAFSLGAFIEGVAGFGAPVAITGAILIQLGFRPLHASGLALIANTAPVAFGSVGIPITTLAAVTGMDVLDLSKMAGRQLPFFSLMVPFWVVMAYSGWRGLRGVWPAALVAGAAFAVPQFLVSNFHGPWLVDNISGACSILALLALLKFWQPQDHFAHAHAASGPAQLPRYNRRQIFGAWLPWIILSAVIFVWAPLPVKKFLNGLSNPKIELSGLHEQIQRVAPVAPPGARPEKAILDFNWLSATGTAGLVSALIAGLVMGFRPAQLFKVYLETIWRIRFSLVTITAMLALGYVTKSSGSDATLGLALAQTGFLYPFFGTLLGWLGVALTGSDTASNVLFGSLQQITAQQTGISPVLMGAANSTGGVMGKMVDAQSIVVASTATGYYGKEGEILRFVFWHSLILAALVGLLVFLQAYVWPFRLMVVP